MPDSDMTTLHFASWTTRQMQSRWQVGRLTNNFAFRTSADSPTAHLSKSNAHLVRWATSPRLFILRVGRLAKCKVVISESGIRFSTMLPLGLVIYNPIGHNVR